MASDNAKRFQKDLRDFYETEFIVTDYAEHDSSYLNVSFHGLADTPHEGGTFEVKICMRPTFPFTPPKVYFVNKVYHPNVAPRDGDVCMNILSEWSPGTRLVEVVEACRALLNSPYPDSPLNQDAACMLKNNEEVYLDTAKYWTAVFANGPDRPLLLRSKVQEVMHEKPRLDEEAVVKLLTRYMWCIEAALGRPPWA